MGTEDFMKLVLPQRGWYGLAVGPYGHKLFDNTAGMAAHGLGESGFADIYFTGCSFREGQRRTSAGAESRNAFIIDVDVRADKPNHYDTVDEARQGVADMVATGKVPEPSAVVFTGGGLHVYWVSPIDLSAAEWVAANRQFLEIAKGAADPRVLSDIATSRRLPGLYRVPGTINRKYGTEVVVEGGTLAPVGKAFVRELFLAADSAGVGLSTFDETGMVGVVEGRDNFGSSSPAFDYTAGVCALLSQLVAEPRGWSEPTWRCIAQMLSEESDGRERFHALSSKDAEQYTHEECETKFDHVSENLSSAVSCETLREACGDSQACRSCPMFTAPVEGYRSPARYARAVGAARGKERLAEIAAAQQRLQPAVSSKAEDFAGVVFTEEQLLDDSKTALTHGMLQAGADDPCGFFYDAGVLKHLSRATKSDPNPVPSRVMPEEIWPVAVANTDAAVGVQAAEYVYAVRDVDLAGNRGPTRLVRLKADAVTPDAVTVAFRKQHCSVMQGPLMARFCTLSVEFLNASKSTRSVTVYDRMGWVKTQHGEGFLIGSDMYVGNRRRKKAWVSDDAAAQLGRRGMAPESKGSLQKQVDLIRLYGDRSMFPTGHARGLVLLSLAAPLMRFAPTQGQTVLLNGDSAMGKTTMARAVMSFWGHPEGVGINAGSSNVALEGEMHYRRDIPGFIDEAGVSKDSMSSAASKFRALVLTGTEGAGKDRLLTTGKASEVKHDWRGLFIVTTNLTAEELTSSKDESAQDTATLVRIFNMTFRSGSAATDPNRASEAARAMSENYGLVGPLFIDYVLTHFDKVKSAVQDMCEATRKAEGAAPQERFMHDLVAVCRVVEAILRKLGVIEDMDNWADDLVSVFNGTGVEPRVATAPAPSGAVSFGKPLVINRAESVAPESVSDMREIIDSFLASGKYKMLDVATVGLNTGAGATAGYIVPNSNSGGRLGEVVIMERALAEFIRNNYNVSDMAAVVRLWQRHGFPVDRSRYTTYLDVDPRFVSGPNGRAFRISRDAVAQHTTNTNTNTNMENQHGEPT